MRKDDVCSWRGRWKKLAPTATKKENFLFLWLLVQVFFTAPLLLELDQLTDLHAKEVMYHASSYVQKVHQPQVPGLRCHCQQGKCQKSFWSFDDWAQWQLPDMAFKCLTGTSMIEEWITDAYCIMSLLNHIVPYVRQVTARWSTGKSCQRVQFEELESHDQKALWHEIGLSQT